jgi:hypothetical protein
MAPGLLNLPGDNRTLERGLRNDEIPTARAGWCFLEAALKP